MFPLDQNGDVAAPRSEDPKLTIHVINFELVQPICPGYINGTDRPTDGRMDDIHRDGKRPDGLTLISFQEGKPFFWDVTVTTSLAESYVDTAAIRAGLVAEQAANRKLTKYAELAPDYILPGMWSRSQRLGLVSVSAQKVSASRLGSRTFSSRRDISCMRAVHNFSSPIQTSMP